MQLKVSFPIVTFQNWEDILDFTLTNIHFEPKAISAPKAYPKEYHDFEKNDAIKVLNDFNPDRFNLADDYYSEQDETNHLFYRVDKFTNTQFFAFSAEDIDSNTLKKIIQSAHKKGFFLSYYFNPLNAANQSEEIISNLEYQNKPHSHLPKRWDPLLSPAIESEVIDIFYNPGHEKLTNGTWLMAAPEMWFGKHAWHYFNKEKIKSFKGAIEIIELEEDLLYVKLFDPKTLNYEAKEILEIQTAFREQSEMNRIEKELDEIAKENRLNH